MEQLPPPSESDKAQRHERLPMTQADRRQLWIKYKPGFIALTGVYLVLTVIRDIRDNFAVEIWAELGYQGQSSILTTSELPVAGLALLGVGSLIMVKNNFIAFKINHIITFGSCLLLCLSTLLFQQGLITPLMWMVLSGFALFVPYIIFNGILFDRLLAVFRERGNVGFLMYIADAIGYLGSVMILLWRNFGFSEMSWLDFYIKICYIGAALLGSLIFFSWGYFLLKARNIRPGF
jgi:hypothetical protein